ncbi:GFA family protein [Leisingera sp. MMG026]|uniref:GFA family protein n=1 Tax=Leisingera sp. MMG026 TaxID=2909982 RepID=UPI001F1BD71D|nr:GFA family protein [Leisingera sp. MMG026]MCF6431786.1 GFA family protein [Leisingera sp. MMG026]
MRGRCLCGSVTFDVDLPVLSTVNCHCESCRRQCSAPMTTYFGVEDGQWRWTGEQPKLFCSSVDVERTFCGNCGSPMSFRSQTMSGTMHFYVAALEDPEAFAPTLHVAHEEKLCWLNSDDGLPKRTGPEYL